MDILLETVVETMASAGYSKRERHDVRLVMEEAVVNAIKHGHCSKSGKRVVVDCLVAADAVFARVEDEGPGFNPHTLPDPRDPANWERTCGRGVFLIQSLSTWAQYNARGNCVTFCKRRAA